MIRVLALDDDNHDAMFAMENGERFGYASEFLKFLAKPHVEEYEIRGFCIIDYNDPAAELSEEIVDSMFYCLEGYGVGPEDYTYEEMFNILWTSSSERWRG